MIDCRLRRLAADAGWKSQQVKTDGGHHAARDFNGLGISSRAQGVARGNAIRRRAANGNVLEAAGMRLEEHRLRVLHERHVEEIDPAARRVAFIGVAVPAPGWGQHDIAGRHVHARAVDDRVGAGLRFDDKAQRGGGVAMRARLLARLHHLVGGDEIAAGRVEIAGDRIDHDQVAPLRLLDGNEFARAFERSPCCREAPHCRLELWSWRRPHRRLGACPAR